MCGIFAYKGPNKAAASMVIDGLKRLEYRGYDSWGIAYKCEQELNVVKQVGKISEFDPHEACLDDASKSLEGQSQIAIAHTRWATHGGVTERNAHPHTSSDGKIAVVHNGIFENYLEIKEELVKKGVSSSYVLWNWEALKSFLVC